ILRRFLAAGEVQVAPSWRAAAHHDRVVALIQQSSETVDPRAAAELDAHVEDIAPLLVDHRFRQPKLWDLAADHPARLRVAVVNCALVSERREVARGRERGGPGTDERDTLAVLAGRALRQAVADVILLVGGDA